MPVAQAKKPPAVSRNAFIAAFYPWVQGTPLNSLFEKIKDHKPAVALIDDAIEMVVDLRVSSYDHWWFQNSWRYDHLREIERRAARECVRGFIAEVQLGRISV